MDAPARRDHWDILGIPSGSSPKEIKSAYRRLCLVVHPDKENGGTDAFLRLHDAYQRAIAQAQAPERRFGVTDFLNFEHNSLPVAKAIRRDDPDGLPNRDITLGLGNTLLHFAAKFSAINCLRVLVTPTLPASQLFTINDAGETPLSLATGECLALLKKHVHGAEPRPSTSQGWQASQRKTPSRPHTVAASGVTSEKRPCTEDIKRLMKLSSMVASLEETGRREGESWQDDRAQTPARGVTPPPGCDRWQGERPGSRSHSFRRQSEPVPQRSEDQSSGRSRNEDAAEPLGDGDRAGTEPVAPNVPEVKGAWMPCPDRTKHATMGGWMRTSARKESSRSSTNDLQNVISRFVSDNRAATPSNWRTTLDGVAGADTRAATTSNWRTKGDRAGCSSDSRAPTPSNWRTKGDRPGGCSDTRAATPSSWRARVEEMAAGAADTRAATTSNWRIKADASALARNSQCTPTSKGVWATSNSGRRKLPRGTRTPEPRAPRGQKWGKANGFGLNCYGVT